MGQGRGSDAFPAFFAKKVPFLSGETHIWL